jgi:hypothetical protein
MYRAMTVDGVSTTTEIQEVRNDVGIFEEAARFQAAVETLADGLKVRRVSHVRFPDP